MEEIDGGGGLTLSPQYAHVFKELDAAVQQSDEELRLATERLGAVHEAAEKLNELGVTGAVLNQEVVSELETQWTQAEFNHSMLKLAQLAVPYTVLPETDMREEVPEAPVETAKSIKEKPAVASIDEATKVSAEQNREPNVSAELERTVIETLNAGGKFSSDAVPGVGGEVRRLLGFSNNEWAKVRKEGDRSQLMYFKKRSSKIIEELGVNLDILEQAVQDGIVSSAVRESFLQFIEREPNVSKRRRQGLKAEWVGEAENAEGELYEALADTDEAVEGDDLYSEETTGRLLDLDSYEIARQSAPVKRSNGQKAETSRRGKSMGLYFKVAGKHFSRDMQVGTFGVLPARLRMLIAVGQANSHSFAFLDNDLLRKKTFIATITNKGIDREDLLSSETVASLIGEAELEGLIHTNGLGPELTEAGIDEVLKLTKIGRFGRMAVATS